ncbi:MAG: glutamyl-tRNA amidotransferase, partial [Gammaproteobacteria bacterium RIFCSPHIGHO2_12_FULL_42_10]
MTDNLKTTLQDHMKDAMRTQDKFRLGVIRLILSTMKQQEVGGLEGRVVLSDEQILAILNKMIKQRRESIAQYEAGHRPELAKIESDEILIIQQYLPNQLSEAEITAAIAAAIKESGAATQKDMGKVMGILKNTLAGKAEMGIVSGK